ncbi:hypothetical protein Pan216_09940 [Planctomycetes bacterium Pan216]|uniref:Peptidase M48 domain-containing protein n=1 Tax=Kolteria novifilia TaxID=2527975 RepID=A0A518AZI3_9BACT|nr:hypothetical protein Pan216_09940 [Planctomycetes bacterium Pan216]
MMSKFLRHTLAMLIAIPLAGVNLGCQGTSARAARRQSPPSSALAANPQPRAADATPIDLVEKAGSSKPASTKEEPARPICDPEDVQRILDEVGGRLAEASGSRGITFTFQSIYNPTPRSHHSDKGTIYVSCGMLKALTSKDELAAVLAMEMAEFLAEEQATTETASESPLAIATRLVKDSGYDQEKLRVVAARFDQKAPVSRL